MKKFVHFDLFHLSLVLSLLRLYPNLYRGTSWDTEPYENDVYLGDSAAYIQTRFHNLNTHHVDGFVHPKNIDNAIERSLFIHDINSLYRRPVWNSITPRSGTNVFAYIVNELQPQSLARSTQDNQEPQPSGSPSEATPSELTQADMNLIETLWMQDIDLGVSREVFDGSLKPKEIPEEKQDDKSSNLPEPGSSFSDPWQGLNYSIDSETGEHIALPLVETSETPSNASALVPNNYVDITLEEALSLFESDDLNSEVKPIDELPTEDFLLRPELPYPETILDQSLLEQLQDLQDLVSEAQSGNFTDHYESINPAYLELPQAYNETDTSNAILNALLQNTSLALPMPESLLNASYNPDDSPDMEHDTNINTLLSFLSNDTDPNPMGAVGGQEQNELCPSLPIANLTAETSFLSELINENNIDFSEFCEPTNPIVNTNVDDWHASTSSDSAISNMGSDWSDTCSVASNYNGVSTHIPESKNFGFYLRNQHQFDNQEWTPPKPMFVSQNGQRFEKQEIMELQEDSDHSQSTSESKVFSSSSPDEGSEGPSSTESTSPPQISFLHNHTYHYAGDAVPDKGASQKPLERDKPMLKQEYGIRGTRDEKHLRNAKVPLSLKDIIELPIERFNEKLSQIKLSDEQHSLIRDIRRRGKNKLAARSCRKRKIDQISDLQTILDNLSHKRDMAFDHLEEAIAHRDLVKQKYERLYRLIFPDPNPPEPIPSSFYLPEHSVVPSTGFAVAANGTATNEDNKKRRAKHKGANNQN